MLLTMRPTGGDSPVYEGRQNWTVFDDGEPIGRSTKTRPRARRPICARFWSITVYVGSKAGIVTNGKVPTLDQAADSIRPGEAAVIRHFQERMPYGLLVPEVPSARLPVMAAELVRKSGNTPRSRR
jgi:hypothetical protein